MEIFTTITLASIIGALTLFFGILVKVVGFPDQIIKNYKRKSAKGLSLKLYVLSFIVYLLWTVHGIMQDDWILILGQGLGILTTGIILAQILIYK